MKSKIALTLALASMFIAPVYAVETQTATPSATMSATDNNMATDDQKQKSIDALAWLIVVNKNEIAASKEALKQKLSPAVKGYARMMVKQHGQSLDKATQMARKMGMKSDMTIEQAKALKEEGDTNLKNLKDSKGQGFQAAYMEMMIKGHTDALQGLDNMMANVTNPQVLNFLKNTRETVQHHLDQAKEIQQKMNTSN